MSANQLHVQAHCICGPRLRSTHRITYPPCLARGPCPAGTMGRHYAAKQGLPAAVAEAIFEAALPRQAGDQLPASAPGVLVAVADRLDSLVGLFAAGCAPSAATDPYGLRRAAVGMLQTLISTRTRLSLRGVVALAAGEQPIAAGADVQGAVVAYVSGRLEQLLVDSG